MKRKTKKLDEGKLYAFRLWPPYAERILKNAKAAKLKENEYARIATMAFADAGLLDLGERMKRLEEQLIRLRSDLSKDFNHALSDDGGEC